MKYISFGNNLMFSIEKYKYRMFIIEHFYLSVYNVYVF